jgi:hypothetical protein
MPSAQQTALGQPGSFPFVGPEDIYTGDGPPGSYPGPGTLPVNPDVSWETNVETTAPYKIAHFRRQGQGEALFSGNTRYITGGMSPAMSQYDSLDGANNDDNLTRRITGGNVIDVGSLPLDAPTTTRRGRVGAVRNSLPASAFFQGYWNTRWSGIFSGMGLQGRPFITPASRAALQVNWAPTLPGSKELHRATQFNPFPPMGSIVPTLTLEPKAV